MSDPNRIRRQQLIRQAEGYLELITLYGERWTCAAPVRDTLASRAIETLERALEAEPEMAIVHYNLACYWSLAGNARHAVSFLAQAFELQPEYREHVLKEHDFDPIRNHPYFQALTTVIV